MIPVLAEAGYRVVAPDHIGMGRSDKPVDPRVHDFENHVSGMKLLIGELGLADITLFVQDWGSHVGLRIAGDQPELLADPPIGLHGSRCGRLRTGAQSHESSPIPRR